MMLFSFNKFVNNLDLDIFRTNPDSFPCKCNDSPFADILHENIVKGDIRLIKTMFSEKAGRFRKKISVVF